MWVAAATWRFGKKAVQGGSQVLANGSPALDAVEYGVRLVEADPNVDSVGLGGIANFDGVVELDASMMDGRIAAGSVGALTDVVHAVSVARQVMEKTPFILLSGAAATRFALQAGMPKSSLLTDASRSKWREMKWQMGDQWTEENWEKSMMRSIDRSRGDGVGMIALDMDGMIAAAVSSSGEPLKIPGTIGDSALVGAGLYATNLVGAVVSTGRGQTAIRHVLSKTTCSLMEQGLSPQAACEEGLKPIIRLESEPRVALLAMNTKGEVGSASTFEGFEYCYRSSAMDRESLLEASVIYQ